MSRDVLPFWLPGLPRVPQQCLLANNGLLKGTGGAGGRGGGGGHPSFHPASHQAQAAGSVGRLVLLLEASPTPTTPAQRPERGEQSFPAAQNPHLQASPDTKRLRPFSRPGYPYSLYGQYSHLQAEAMEGGVATQNQETQCGGRAQSLYEKYMYMCIRRYMYNVGVL